MLSRQTKHELAARYEKLILTFNYVKSGRLWSHLWMYLKNRERELQIFGRVYHTSFLEKVFRSDKK